MLRTSNTPFDFIAGIKCKDVHYIESFYDRYSSLLYSMICRDISDHNEAEKLLEEVFCKLAGNTSSFKPGDRFLTWLILFTQKEIQHFISRKTDCQEKLII